jgi:uncharacterized protein (DUF58 family)
VLAARAAATLAWAARDGGDRVGGIILGGSGHKEVPPHRSRGRLVTFLGQISAASEEEALASAGVATSLAEAAERLARVSRPGTLIFLISDFDDLDAAAEREIGRLSQRGDVACLLIYDPLEEAAPGTGFYRVSDGERVLQLATGDGEWRREYAQRFAARRAALEGLCGRRGMGFLALRTGNDCKEILRTDRFARAFGGARPIGGRS